MQVYTAAHQECKLPKGKSKHDRGRGKKKKSLSLSPKCTPRHGTVCSGGRQKNCFGVLLGHSTARRRLLLWGTQAVRSPKARPCDLRGWDTSRTCSFPSLGNSRRRLTPLEQPGPQNAAALLPPDADRKRPVESARPFTNIPQRSGRWALLRREAKPLSLPSFPQERPSPSSKASRKKKKQNKKHLNRVVCSACPGPVGTGRGGGRVAEGASPGRGLLHRYPPRFGAFPV